MPVMWYTSSLGVRLGSLAMLRSSRLSVEYSRSATVFVIPPKGAAAYSSTVLMNVL